MTKEHMLQDSIEMGVASQGKKEYEKYMNGGKLTLKQSVLAYCYDCAGYYSNGKDDCEMDICPLYPHMPYAKKNNKNINTT